MRRVKDAESAHKAALHMMQGKVLGVDETLAFAAAENGLPMADSLIYATARAHQVILWTQDAHFEGLPGLRYCPKA